MSISATAIIILPWNLNIYGGKAFVRHFIINDFFITGVYERHIYNDNSGVFSNLSMDGAYVGAGLRQWMGTNSFCDLCPFV